MGLLTILKKMKQKEKEMRILMLYPKYKPFGKLNQTSKERDFNLELRLNLSSHQRISPGFLEGRL